MLKQSLLCALLIGSGLLAGCEFNAPQNDVIVSAGDIIDDAAVTINGDIVIGENAQVKGQRVETVNGSIRVKNGARVRNLSTVTGDILVGSGAQTGSIETITGRAECSESVRVDGSIKLINGSVMLNRGATVSGDVNTVNGSIRMHGARVAGNVYNYNGDMMVNDGSIVEGNLSVLGGVAKKGDRLARIVVGPGSKINGRLTFEHEVKLYVHESASIGPVVGAVAQRFSQPMVMGMNEADGG